MVEVLDFIFEILRVQDFANRYTTPLDQFLFAVFFPSVILVLFVELLTTSALKGQSQKFKGLLAVAFYIFIIVYPPGAAYSLYSMFAPILGTVWYLFFILLGFLFFLFNRLFASEGVGVRAESRKLSGSAWEATKEVATDYIEAQSELEKVRSQLAGARATKAALGSGPETKDERAKEQEVIAQLEAQEKALEHRMGTDTILKKKARQWMN